MGKEKDEILRNAKRMAEEEKKRKAMIIRDKPPVDLRSRVPIGCWVWFAVIVFALYVLFRRVMDAL